MAEMTKKPMLGDSYSKMSVPNGGFVSDAATSPDVVKQAKDLASGVAEQAKGLASQVATQAKDMVTSQVTHQQEKSAGDLKDVAKALRQTTEHLDGNMVSPYVGKAADQLERLSQYLRTTNLSEVKGSLEGFARREPLLFMGGAFVLGILGARFLKSSAHESTSSSDPPRAANDGNKTPSYGSARGQTPSRNFYRATPPGAGGASRP